MVINDLWSTLITHQIRTKEQTNLVESFIFIPKDRDSDFKTNKTSNIKVSHQK